MPSSLAIFLFFLTVCLGRVGCSGARKAERHKELAHSDLSSLVFAFVCLAIFRFLGNRTSSSYTRLVMR